MKVLAQWRERLRAIWQLQAVEAGQDAQIAALWEMCRSLENRCMEADQRRVALVAMLENQQKQLADIRAIVANIREETKRGPMQARSVAHLRQFIAESEED